MSEHGDPRIPANQPESYQAAWLFSRLRLLESRGRPARIGTWRSLCWSLLVAVAYFQISNPYQLISDFKWSMLALAAATGIALALDRPNIRPPRIPWTFVVYLGLCAVSVTWSINPSDTVRMTLLYAWLALSASVFVAQTDIQTLLRGIAWGGVLITVGTLISVALDPTRYGRGWIFPGTALGWHGHRGIIAYSLVLSLTAALMRKPSGRRSWFEIAITLAANLGGIVVSHAATGQVGAVCVVIAWVAVLILRQLSGRALIRAWLLMLALAVIATAWALFNRATLAALFGKTADFSDRFSIWQAIYQQWLEAPIGGYGFGAVWYYAWWRLDGSPVLDHMVQLRESWLGDPAFYHGHNLFMDVLPQLGLLGIAAAFLVVGLIAVRGVTGLTEPSGAASWGLLVLVGLLVMGIAEPMLSVPVGWFTAVAATAAARRTPRPAGEET